MKRIILLLSLSIFVSGLNAQVGKKYTDLMKAYQKNYVDSHEVVTGKDRKYFRFFPINQTNRVNCRFEKIDDAIGLP